MKSLRRKWADVLSNPFYLALVLVLTIVAIMFWACPADSAESTEMTIINASLAPIWILVAKEPSGDMVATGKILPGDIKTITIEYGKYLTCGSKDQKNFECNFTEITPENEYDEEGRKQFWEIGE